MGGWVGGSVGRSNLDRRYVAVTNIHIHYKQVPLIPSVPDYPSVRRSVGRSVGRSFGRPIVGGWVGGWVGGSVGRTLMKICRCYQYSYPL